MQLNGDLASRELLFSINSKVEIRKFEYVEPSLNSIFLDVVGVPDERQERRESPAGLTKRESVAGDKRVRNALFMFVAALLVTLVLSVITLKRGDISWNMPEVLLAVSAFSLVKYLRIRKTVAGELQRSAEEVSHAK